jgi:hypothetical protein
LKQTLLKLLLAASIAYLLPQGWALGEAGHRSDLESNEDLSMLADIGERPESLWLDAFRKEVRQLPPGSLAGSSQIAGQDLSFSHSLAQIEENDVSLSAGVHYPQVDGEPLPPDELRPASIDPWNVNVGLRYAQPLGSGWTASSGVNVVSTGDRPVSTLREMNVGVNAMLRMPHDDHNAWIVTVNYSPGSEALPMPGVAFSYDPSTQFHANIGLPFQFAYRPSDSWEFQATYMLVHTIHVKAIYRINDRFTSFAAYDWASETIVLFDSPDPNARLFLNDPRVSAGIQTALPWHWTAITSAGYVFDRYQFDGSSLVGTGGTTADQGNGAFASINVNLRY